MTFSSNDQLSYTQRRMLLTGYGEWMQRWITDEGHTGYLVTFMFNHIPGKPDTVTRIMKKDVEECFYRHLVTRVVRDARKAETDELPKLIGLRDRPVRKHAKMRMRDVTINNGLHVHGILAVPSTARFNWWGNVNLEKIYKYSSIRHIDIEKIKRRANYTTEYALKQIHYDPPSKDEMIVVPWSKSELPSHPVDRSEPVRDRVRW